MNTQPNPEILEHSQNLKWWFKSSSNNEPFTPKNENQKKWFYDNWCSKCQSIKYRECSILIQMYAIGEQPKEIYFYENIPVCEKFKQCQS